MHFLKYRPLKMSITILCLTGLVGTLAGAENTRGNLPVGAPENHGFSPERLKRLANGINRELKARQSPGATIVLLRHGVIVYEKAFGYQDAVTETPMALDSIFRIYSMSKPITSVAAMMLWEEGRFKLTDPVHLYLPEFRNVQVAVMNADGTEILETIPPKRPVTIQDLLRHTSGLTYGLFGEQNAVRKRYTTDGVTRKDISAQELVEKITQIPLMSHPGARWEYSYSTDVLGRLIEVVSGMTLGDFFKERIFEPLGMVDTGFFIPKEKLHRAAQAYDSEKKSYPWGYTDVSKAYALESGGGGLVSTMYDYARFCQMMLNRGKLGGVRLLGPKTVELMTANHVESSVDCGDLYFPGDGHGFGLGFAVRTETGIAGSAGSKGDYRWGGLAGTAFWIDPAEHLISIFMIQDIAESNHHRDRFKTLVYQAIVE
jgi:CubicO group peptidase (beta-lactamase class C family)